jgi:hypothetical protein
VPATGPLIRLFDPPSKPKSAAHNLTFRVTQGGAAALYSDRLLRLRSNRQTLKAIRDKKPNNFLTNPPRVLPIPLFLNQARESREVGSACPYCEGT